MRLLRSVILIAACAFGTVIAVRIDAKYLQPYFVTVETVGRVTNYLDIHNEVRGALIVVCRQIKVRPFKIREAFTHLN